MPSLNGCHTLFSLSSTFPFGRPSGRFQEVWTSLPGRTVPNLLVFHANLERLSYAVSFDFPPLPLPHGQTAPASQQPFRLTPRTPCQQLACTSIAETTDRFQAGLCKGVMFQSSAFKRSGGFSPPRGLLFTHQHARCRWGCCRYLSRAAEQTKQLFS